MKKSEKLGITALSFIALLSTLDSSGFGIAVICQFWSMVILWLWAKTEIIE